MPGAADELFAGELDSSDQRIGDALKVTGQLLIRHPEICDAIWTAGASAKIAQRVVECGIERQDAVNSEQPDRPAGGGPVGDDPESH